MSIIIKQIKDIKEELKKVRDEILLLNEEIVKLKQNNNHLSANKRINDHELIERLNRDTDRITVDLWVTNIDVLTEHLEKVFTYNLIEGIIYCIKSHIIKTKTPMPIAAFKEKKNKLFVITEIGGDKHWIIMDTAWLYKLLSKLAQKFTKTFIQLQPKLLSLTMEENISNQMKIMDTTKLLSSGISLIQRWLYTELL